MALTKVGFCKAKDHEKTLFDFDEDVNDLNAVAERYPIVTEIKEN